MAKPDRRVQRTREQLQKALLELIEEGGYDEISIGEIADRANVGRTTFYLHYGSKDDLFMSCHEQVVSDFHFGPLYPHPLSREELLASGAAPGMIAAYRHLQETWPRLRPIFSGKDGPLLLRRMRESSAGEIEANLRLAFAGADATVPPDVLANYLAGAQLALLQWWLEGGQPHTPESMAQSFHRLQRAAISEAFCPRED